jgi:hypothetical protein
MRKFYTEVFFKTFFIAVCLLSAKVGFSNGHHPNKASIGNHRQLNRLDFTLLNKGVTDSFYSIVDGAVAVFNSNYCNCYNANEDADKIVNPNDNIYIIHSGHTLSIDGRLPVTLNDTIAIGLYLLSSSFNELQVDASSFTTNSGIIPYLYDAYLNTKTPLVSSGITTLDFIVNASIPASYQNRFGIQFLSPTLKVQSIAINTQLQNGNVKIKWSTSNDLIVAKYDIEKSIDAIHFTKLVSVSSSTNSLATPYDYTDALVLNGNNYYRIKAIGLNGEIIYSAISVINKGAVNISYSLYPNPTNGKMVNLQLNNANVGTYQIRIVNGIGQEVNSKTIAHEGGSATYNIFLPLSLKKGMYYVSIYPMNSNERLFQTSLSVQ